MSVTAAAGFAAAGVSAGDEAARRFRSYTKAKHARDEIATRMEYEWQSDPAHDPFAKVWGLA